MDSVHLHLLLNHLPIIGVPLVAALLGYGLLRGSREVIRTGLGAAVVVAALAYPVFLSGEPAEEGIEHRPGFSEQLVHDHEERAEAALVALLLTGAMAAGALWMSRKSTTAPRTMGGITLAGLLLSAGLLGLTGLSGGKIAHEEIRGPLASAAGAEAMGADSLDAARDDDDDDH